MSRAAEVMTVTGPISSKDLGISLPHEHLFIDLRFIHPEREWTTEKVSIKNLHKLRIDYTCLSDNLLLASVETAKHEVIRYRDLGGVSLVDAGSIGTGRKPYALRKVAQDTGVNIIMGTGFYIKQSLNAKILDYPEHQLLSMLVKECQYGYKKSGIRPGVIGEIGVGPYLDEWDQRSLKIASMLQTETGLPITIHIQAVPVIEGFEKPNGIKVVDFLETHGANLSKIVIGHTDAQIDMEYLRILLSRGVFVEFDHFGKEFYLPQQNFCMARDIERIQAIATLVDEGYVDQILVSTDICLKQDLTRYGGHGYAHILETVVPMMRNQGLDSKAIQRIMENNPKRLLEAKSTYF